jgi:uncharacterized membrane protein (DUF106 family)
MALLNRIVNALFDVAMRPLQVLGWVAGLLIVALLTAVSVLLVVRATSNQQALQVVKHQIAADLMEIRLFNDNLRAILRAVFEIARHNGQYLRLSFVPMLWIVIPLTIALIQLHFFFGYTGIAINEPVLVTAEFKTAVQPAALEAPPQVRIDTPAVAFPAVRETVWKIVATTPGDYALRLTVADTTYEKSVHASNGLARRSPVRPPAGEAVLEASYPSESPLPPDAPIASIRIAYPERRIALFGWPVHWMAAYTALALAFGAVLKRPLRVTL